MKKCYRVVAILMMFFLVAGNVHAEGLISKFANTFKFSDEIQASDPTYLCFKSLLDDYLACEEDEKADVLKELVSIHSKSGNRLHNMELELVRDMMDRDEDTRKALRPVGLAMCDDWSDGEGILKFSGGTQATVVSGLKLGGAQALTIVTCIRLAFIGSPGGVMPGSIPASLLLTRRGFRRRDVDRRQVKG